MQVTFPLNKTTGKYELSHFNPSDLDNRCQLSDIENFFDDIYKSTNNLALLRRISHLLLLVTLSGISLLTFGIALHSYGYYADKSREADLGMYLMLLSPILMISGFCIYGGSGASRLNQTHAIITEVITRNKERLEGMGLKWDVEKDCRYFELSLENKTQREGYCPPELNEVYTA